MFAPRQDLLVRGDQLRWLNAIQSDLCGSPETRPDALIDGYRARGRSAAHEAELVTEPSASLFPLTFDTRRTPSDREPLRPYRLGPRTATILRMESHWWRAFASGSCWYGVFQGGGAKGAAYAGPLRTFAGSRQWFREVAGASAGALTASLIAAGYHPDELAELTAPLLATVKPATPLDRLVSTTSVTRWMTRYRATSLEEKLEEYLRAGVARHGGDPTIPVTFRSLYEATGIRLTVVALDASVGQPLPFCVQWSPDLPVAPAVIASCSIPVVFPSPFLEVRDYSRALTPWRRLADGGVYANYPGFVSHEESFRRYFEMGDLDDPKVIGFVFGDPASITRPRPGRFVTDPHGILDDVQLRVLERGGSIDSAADDANSIKSALLIDAGNEAERSPTLSRSLARYEALGDVERRRQRLSTGARLILIRSLAVAGQLALIAVIAALWYTGAVRSFQGPVVSCVAGWLLFVSALLSSIVFVSLRRFALCVAREGPGVLRSWSGHALRPPAWAGAVPGSFVVFVDAVGLSTTDFRPSSAAVELALWTAEVNSRLQVEAIIGGESALSSNANTFRKISDSWGSIGYEDRLPSHPHRRPWRVRLRQSLW